MSRFARASMLSIFVFAMMPLTASAQLGTFAWVSADRPSYESEYVATANLSRNSEGGVNRIDRLQKGVYLVLMEKVGAAYGGNVQVVAYGSDDARCHLMYQTEIDDVKRLIVGCTDETGDFVDTTFTASFVKQFSFPFPLGFDTGRAYALVSYPSADMEWDEDEVSEYRYNSSGDGTGFVYVSKGLYLLRFFGQSSATPIYRVTPYGLFSNVRCKAGSTSTEGLLSIACFDSTGARADSAFFVSYEGTRAHSAITSAHFRTNADASEVFDAYNGANTSATAITVSHYSPGFYIARLRNMAAPTDALGTAYVGALSSSTSSYCKPTGWVKSQGTDILVGIFCFNQAGSLADSAFTLSYQR